MKIVISGGTGYIGGAVLQQCLRNPSITSILLLSRRDVGEIAKNPKVQVLILKDFTLYDEAAIDQVKDADAALWCLGTYDGDKTIDIDFPLAFINIIKARSPGAKPFRYVQLSGAFTEPPPKEGEAERTLWFFTSGRRIRGAAEARVLETADGGDQDRYAVYLVKPGGILNETWSSLQGVFGNSLSIRMSDLVTTMVDLAVNGNEKKIFSNQEIIQHAKLLKQVSS